MATITLDSWGTLGIGTIRVRVTETRSVREAAAARLAREHGLSVCGGPRLDHVRNGVGVYCVTLGERVRGGGYRPRGEVWFTAL